ncbi:MAG: RNA 2'-phosphotransferase [Gemmatimonadetes bacterium]|nr:RNA 2'-phosphotransferase [Gemmatimonadota bacterium]MDE3257457.1 RNA 2'-phosphotransferase [Gemmatimonadota bacterium]
MEGYRSPVRVSKLLSLMLRHRPEEFGIQVDGYGFADFDAVISALKKQDADIEVSDVEALVYRASKKRFEIVEGRIRARYGHSFAMELGTEPIDPPEHLYKGASVSEVEAILRSGLKPENRQYVHLSFDADVARRLAGHRQGPGTVIRVEARKAAEGGVQFFDCGPTVLSREIPSDFLSVEDTPAPVPDGGVSEKQSEQPVTYGRKRRFGSRR